MDAVCSNRFPWQDQNTPQLQSPDGWKELKSRYPTYASIFLNCNQCTKPHCHCAKVDVCNQKCPNKAEVSQLKNGATGKGPHISHCPLCLRIGTGSDRGITCRRGISAYIELYSCYNCEAFCREWNNPTELKLMNEMKCNSVSNRKGECPNYWNCELFKFDINLGSFVI